MMKNEVLNFGVHGVFGIGVENSALNAGTDGMLRMNSKGEFYATGTSLKYPMKVLWEQNGEKVLGIRSYKNAKNENIPRSLRERFEYLTDSDVKEFSDDELMKSLFTFTDVKNFGCLFLIPNVKNVGIRGAVQIQDGYNKYSDATMIVQDILSCYRNPNEKPKTDNKNSEKKANESSSERKATSMGTRLITDEAHYFSSFRINPLAYANEINAGYTEGYTAKDYALFKEAVLTAQSLFDSRSKAGCVNEFAMFVETELGVGFDNLTKYIRFTKNDCSKNVIDLSECSKYLNKHKDLIKGIEIYSNEETTELVGLDMDHVTIKDIPVK